MRFIANPYSVYCRYCGADKNLACLTKTARVARPHAVRHWDAETERMVHAAMAGKRGVLSSEEQKQ